MRRREIISSNTDSGLLFVTVALSILGIIMVFSSSVIMADVRWKSPYIFVTKQTIWIILGMISMFVMANMKYEKLQSIAKPLLFVSILFLIAVLIFGPEKGGAKRWLRWGLLSFQPSELAKLAVVVAVADYLDRKKSRLSSFKGLWPTLVIIGVLCGLIGLEPDLGTPILICSVTICLLLVGGARIWHLLLIGLSFLPFIVVEIMRKPYRLYRIKKYMESWTDLNSGSYQLTQSILALGSGGFFGKGLAQGDLKLMYLPEAHTDFIFPIIGEELGFVGALLVIFMFLVFAYRGLNIAKNAKTYFGSILAAGLTLMIVFQALINIGVSCGLLPTKGLPLPFVSFGGSALFFNLFEVGILLSISRGQKP